MMFTTPWCGPESRDGPQMTDREDDGIVTCGDGHTEYFDE